MFDRGVLTKFQNAVFVLVLFLLPTQLGFHFWPEWAHVFGIRIDYLAPTLYLTDLLVLPLVLPLLVGLKTTKWKLALLLVFIAANVFVAANKFVTIYKWLKVAEFALLAIFTATSVTKETLRKGILALLAAAAAAGFLGVIQFLVQKNLGGIFYFLGERAITGQTPGAALVALGGKELLRAYSVFSHPNSFAGFLVVTLPLAGLVYPDLPPRYKRALVAACGLIVFGVLVSFSRSGIFVLLVLLPLMLGKIDIKKIVRPALWLTVVGSLLLPLVSLWINGTQRTVAERLVLARAAGQLFAEHPLFGVGLNNFITSAQTAVGNLPLVWQFQPVHNIFLLALAETGIVGLLLVVLLFWKITTTCNRLVCLSVLAILLTGFLDHYWFTLQQNQLLFSLVVGLALRPNFKNE